MTLVNARCPVLLAAALALAACGGSSSGGNAPPASRNTVGAITAADPVAHTIVVNGKTLAVQGAAITEDRVAATEDRLTKGTIVTVTGSFDDRAGSASEVEIEHGLEGEVDDKGADFITIAGQRVHVDDSTEFDDSNRLGGVVVGATRVKVSGVPDDSGALRASRVSRSTRAAGGDDVKGFVSSLSGKTFDLALSPDASACWNVDATGIASLPPGLANGAFVEVRTSAAPGAGTTCALGALVATAIQVEDRFTETEVEVEGIVTSGTSSQFVANGTTVQTSGSTGWRLGAPADLVAGAKVEAEGSLDAHGVLQATKVSFRPGVRLTAVVDAVQADAITMLGMRVQTPSFMRNEFGALAAGDRVEVRGNPSADGAGLVAYRIVNPGGGSTGRVLLRALASDRSASSASPTFTVMGFTVTPKAGAQFLGSSGTPGVDGAPIAPTDFWNHVEPGHTVIRVRAASGADVSVPNHAFDADELEIEGSDD
jgi:energy-converting hydrogenase Eha subunit B